jgi:hypothetical protein
LNAPAARWSVPAAAVGAGCGWSASVSAENRLAKVAISSVPAFGAD